MWRFFLNSMGIKIQCYPRSMNFFTITSLLLLSSCNQVTNSSGTLSKLPMQRIWILEMKWSWIWAYLITKEWISGKHYLFIGTQIGQTSLQHHPLFIKMSYEHCLFRKLINEINLKLIHRWSETVSNRKYHIKTMQDRIVAIVYQWYYIINKNSAWGKILQWREKLLNICHKKQLVAFDN